METDFFWDLDQAAVIQAAPVAHLLVESAPGCGKTAVACARVAHLIDLGLEPANILLLSFTRTAVAELRNRIAALASDVERARAVKITTLDSEVWHLLYGFDEVEVNRLFGGYESNIERVLKMLRSQHQELSDYLSRLEHLIVDEAQDLTGVRADLVIELIRSLPGDCGVTIFADGAQAIYGFTTDDEEERNNICPGDFLSLIDNHQAPEFERRQLTEIHRTYRPGLVKICRETRRHIFDDSLSAFDRFKAVTDSIRLFADGTVASIEDEQIANCPDTLVLFRRRSEVLVASSILSGKGIEHRVRMSGLTVIIYPWVAWILGSFTGPYLDRGEFDRRWDDPLVSSVAAGLGSEDAWQLLFRFAGDARGRIEMRKLRRVLSRSRPPVELCQPECGTRGAIVGTIHASKGREASRVVLMIPTVSSSLDQDEESRVMYVGATRARRELKVGDRPFMRAARLEESGRVYRIIKSTHSAQIEFGREGDLDPMAHAGRGVCTSGDDAMKTQRVLAGIANENRGVQGICDRAWDYNYRIYLDHSGEMIPIGCFHQTVNRDLWTILREFERQTGRRRLKPPEHIDHLYISGVRTVVLPEDHPDLHLLHHPYAISGILLAPVITGFPFVRFPFKTRKWGGS